MILEAAAGPAQRPGWRSRTHAREGDPADAILDVAEEVNADLIVVGNKGMTGAQALPARQRAEQDLPPRALQRLHRAHDLGSAR